MWFLDNCKTHQRLMNKELHLTNEKINKMPKGKLVIKTSRGKKYYYLKEKDKVTSLFSNSEMAKNMVEKRQLLKAAEQIKENLKMIERMMLQYKPITELQINNLLWDEFQEMQNSGYSDNMRHEYRGVLYRSKSEVLIATMLHSYDIVPKYEVKLTYGGKVYYPDFVLRRKSDGRIFVWEHFGLVNDAQYLNHTFEKIATYHKMGYNLWDNLIVTFDDKDGGINADVIEKIIKLYLI